MIWNYYCVTDTDTTPPPGSLSVKICRFVIPENYNYGKLTDTDTNL